MKHIDHKIRVQGEPELVCYVLDVLYTEPARGSVKAARVRSTVRVSFQLDKLAVEFEFGPEPRLVELWNGKPVNRRGKAHGRRPFHPCGVDAGKAASTADALRQGHRPYPTARTWLEGRPVSTGLKVHKPA